jgi:hypothetical protein
MNEILRRQNSRTYLANFSVLLLGVCYNLQRALVAESGIIKTHMGNSVDQNMVAVPGTLCTIPPLNNIK